MLYLTKQLIEGFKMTEAQTIPEYIIIGFMLHTLLSACSAIKLLCYNTQ